jgi:hypothetical protein
VYVRRRRVVTEADEHPNGGRAVHGEPGVCMPVDDVRTNDA